MLVVFAHTAAGQILKHFDPEWVEFSYPDGYRPSYNSYGITVSPDGHIYWPVCDYDQTTLVRVEPTKPSFKTSEICRLTGVSEYSNPSVRAIQWYEDNLYVSGLYYNSPIAGSDVGFIACISLTKKDTLWLSLVADSFYLSSTFWDIAVDTSGVYACADGPILCSYTHDGERIWASGLGKKTVYACRSLVVDDSFLYVCGGLSANFPNDKSRACVLKFDKANGVLVDSIFFDIHPDAFGAWIASYIIIKDRSLYVVGTSHHLNDSAIFAAKLSDALSINWYTEWNYAANSEGTGGCVDSAGRLWVSGNISSDTRRSMLLCFSHVGKLAYQGIWDVQYDAEINSIAFANDKIIAAGGCWYVPPNVDPSVQQTAFLFMMNIPLLSGVQKGAKPSSYFRISPNPFEQKTVLTFDNCSDGVMYMEVVNTLGKIMLREEIVDIDGLQQYSADLSMLVPGAYHIRLVCPADGWSATATVVKL